MKAAQSLFLVLGLVVLLLSGCDKDDTGAERGSLGGGPRSDRAFTAVNRENMELVGPSNFKARAKVPARLSPITERAIQERFQLEKQSREKLRVEALPVSNAKFMNLNTDYVRNEDVQIEGITLKLPEICLQAALPLEENSTVAVANGPCPGAGDRISTELVLTVKKLTPPEGFDGIPTIAKEFELVAGDKAIGQIRAIFGPYQVSLPNGGIGMTMKSSVQLVSLCEGEKYRAACGLK